MKKRKEIKYYGVYSSLMLFKMRKDDIIRVYLDKCHLKTFKEVLKWCSENKKAYHLVSSEELERVSGSVHHEGVCILAKELELTPVEQVENKIFQKKDGLVLLYLDGVENPHNIGSIIRAMAHFSVIYILGEKGKLLSLSPSAYRIAKGGAEFVKLVPLEKPVAFLSKLKKHGFTLVTTTSHGGNSLYNYKFSPLSVIVMGSESDGISKSIFSLADDKVEIKGTGYVESLNVAIATTLIVAEYMRQHIF